MKSPLHILLVEDNEDDAELLLSVIRKGELEFVCERVQTADELTRALLKQDWDIVLSDYSLPSFSAPEALKILQASNPHIPAIIISGTIGEDIAVETLRLGASDYLLKQSLTRLVPAIKRTLEEAETCRQKAAAEHMNSLIMANSLDAICVLDKNGIIQNASKASKLIWNYSPESLRHRSIFDITHPSDLEMARRFFLSVVDGQAVRDFVCRMIRADGSLVDVMWSGYWSPSDELVFAVARDITDRRKAEQEIRFMLQRMKIAAAASHSGIWEYDPTSEKIVWDEQMCRLYGIDQDAAPNTLEQWFHYLSPQDIARCQHETGQAVESGATSFSIEYEIKRGDTSEPRSIRSMASISRDKAGRPILMIGTNQDVTLERNRERELAAALAHEKELAEKARAGDRAKSEFLAVMSHELRTPMNGILGFAELLVHSPSLSGDCLRHAEIIIQSGEALLRILDDILDFSRIEAGRLQIESRKFETRKLAQGVCDLLAQQASAKALSLSAMVDAAVPHYLEGDESRIRQILLNLLGNALKFTERGSISLHISPSPSPPAGEISLFEFRVTDTGPGIASDKIDTIFQPFTQADSSISRRHGGTGLGLTISRRLTELLDGTLSVQSELTKGSSFLLKIPLVISDATQSPAPQPSALPLNLDFASQHPQTILVVEDDHINLKLILALIRKLGYQPLSAQNGREAVSLYRDQFPDCILMDLQMPEMDGIEASHTIRALEPEKGAVYIAALTANIFPADRERCLSSGMNFYINKPVKISALAETLIQSHAHRINRLAMQPRMDSL